MADAILFAAEHPKRQLYVGGNGYLISLGGRFAKRATDAAMKMLGQRLQTDEHQPSPPATRDNLFEPRQDGSIDGHQEYYVRRTSLLLEAQKRPALALLTTAGLGLLVIAGRRGMA